MLRREGLRPTVNFLARPNSKHIEYLVLMTDEPDSELVSQLARDFLQRCREGQRPALSEYVELHPELESQIREVFPMMQLMEDVAPGDETSETAADLKRLGDFEIHRVIGQGGMGVVYEATQQSLGRRVALKVCPLSQRMSRRNRERFRRESRAAALLHHTNIVPVFAVGEEEGTLYYAMQYIRGATLDDVIQELRRLWRSVPTANTRLSSGVRGASNSNEVPQRNAASEVAQSLALNSFVGENVDPENKLAANGEPKAPASPQDSTRKVTTSEVGDFGSSITNVSLPGQTIADSESGATAKYWESIGRIGVQVAEALAYAHDKGTLHRDIKPSNLMLDQSGTVWVMDFGLAKSLEEDDLTRTGELIGTLRYMPPEQCKGNPAPASDIYSLGLTLYELLALRPAFEEVHRSELLRAIMENDSTPLRKINSDIPRDLETIVHKSIEREPARRYSSAQELADDLKRFVAGEPILARPVGVSERIGKWVRRRPMVATLLTALAVLIVVSFALVTWNWRVAEIARSDAVVQKQQADKARQEADEQQRIAQQRLEQAEAALYRDAISRAYATSDSNPANARAILESLRPENGEPNEVDRRGWEWGYLNELVNQQVATFDGGAPEAEWIRTIAFSHDDSLLAVGAGRTGSLEPVGRSPKGRATIWNTQTAQQVAELPIEHTAYALAFDGDNKRIAVSEVTATDHFEHEFYGTVHVWSIERAEPIVELQMGDFPANSGRPRVKPLHFTKDDRYIIGTIWGTSPVPYEIAIWDPNNGTKLWKVEGAELIRLDDEKDRFVALFKGSETMDFRPGRLVLHDLNTRSSVEDVRELVWMRGQLSDNLNMVAFYDAYHRVTLRDFQNNRVAKLWGHDQYKVCYQFPSQPICDFSPSDQHLATAGADGTVRIWNTTDGTLRRILHGHQAPVQAVAYSHDGNQLASGDWSGQVRLWQPDTYEHQQNCQVRGRLRGQCFIEAVAFRWSGAGVVAQESGRTSCWNSENGWLLHDRSSISLPVQMGSREAVFDQQGKRVAAIGTDQAIHVVDVESGQTILERKATARPREIAINADGRRIAVSHFSTDSRSTNPSTNAAAASSESTIEVWDCGGASASKPDVSGTAGLRWHCSRNADIAALAIDHLGNLLAFATIRGTRHRFSDDLQCKVEIINLVTDDHLEILQTQHNISTLEFSHDGKRLAVCTLEGTLAIYDSRSGEATVPPFSVPQGIEDLAWHPAGTRLAGVNRDVVTLWDDEGSEILTLRGESRSRNLPYDPAVAFSADGTKLAATQWNNTIAVWTSTLSEPFSKDSRRSPQNELARHAIDRAAASHPRNGWYRAARGQIRASEIDSSSTQDYLLAKKELSGDEPCLFVHGDAYIEAPSILFYESDEYTLECWIRNWNFMSHAYFFYGVIASQYPAPRTPYWRDHELRWRAEIGRGYYWLMPPRTLSPTLRDTWVHIAVSQDAISKRYYVNGVLEQTRPPRNAKDLTGNFYVADSEFHEPHKKGRGCIRSLRVSDRARYRNAFRPDQTFEPDESTLLLFDFTIDDGVTGSPEEARFITDRSGHENHGTLHDAWWLSGNHGEHSPH